MDADRAGFRDRALRAGGDSGERQAMRIAVFWPPGEEARPGAAGDAEKAGRYIAAGGHGLLLVSPEDAALAAAGAYRKAGGPFLAAAFPAGESAEAGPPFDERIPGISPAELPARICADADALLAMGDPDASWIEAARKSGKPLYAIGASAAGRPAGGAILLSGVDSFAREIAKAFSRGIVSAPRRNKFRSGGKGAGRRPIK